MADLSRWIPEPEAARVLGVSTKTLIRWAEIGKVERQMRPRQGRKAEPVYNPDDLAKQAAFKPHLLPKEAVLPERRPQPERPPVSLDLTPLALALERVLLARIPPPAIPAPEPKPHVTAAEAGARLGVTEKLVKRLVSKGAWPGFRDCDGQWKLRSSVLDNLDIVSGLSKLKEVTARIRESRKASAA
jgi:hypothetical protein